MTTNIYDSNQFIMATDSRWSIQLGCWLMYADEVGYDKIIHQRGKVLMFAGFGSAIQAWKDWILSTPIGPVDMPPHKGMAVCMVDATTKIVDFDAHQDIVDSGVYCAGSGARHAYGCWKSNNSAIKAVETAKSMDIFSGGEIKYFDCNNQSNNLTQLAPLTNITINTVDEAILRGGKIMKINLPSPGNPPFSLRTESSANDDGEASAIALITRKVASGELSATAPCDGMHNDWTDVNKEKFTLALGNMFGWK